MWPVNGTPASLMTLFCTGAVTMAWNCRSTQPSIARSRSLQDVPGIGGIERAGDAGRIERHIDHVDAASFLERVLAARQIGPYLDVTPQLARPARSAARDCR